MKKEYIIPRVIAVKANISSSILETSMIDAGGKTPSFDAKEGRWYDEEDDDGEDSSY